MFSSVASMHARVTSSSSVNYLSAKKENITVFIHYPASDPTYFNFCDKQLFVSYGALLTHFGNFQEFKEILLYNFLN